MKIKFIDIDGNDITFVVNTADLSFTLSMNGRRAQTSGRSLDTALIIEPLVFTEAKGWHPAEGILRVLNATRSENYYSTQVKPDDWERVKASPTIMRVTVLQLQLNELYKFIGPDSFLRRKHKTKPRLIPIVFCGPGLESGLVLDSRDNRMLEWVPVGKEKRERPK